MSTGSCKPPRSVEAGSRSEYVGELILGLKDREDDKQKKGQKQEHQACFLPKVVHPYA